MRARALICDANQQFSIQDVNLNGPAPDQLLIRTLWTGVSIGTEFALIRNKISWGPYPLCTGYQGTGVVEEVGSDITDFAIGDLVYFRGNDHMELADGTPVSCVSGAHASHAIRKPAGTHGVAKLPPGAPVDLASMFVMPAVGLTGVDMANPRMGAVVVVHGAGLIGQGVIAACVHRGCVVVAVDINPRQLEMARKMGADHLINSAETDAVAAINEISPGGADFVFECTGIPACIDPAIALCKPRATFVWQGNYGAEPVSMHFLPAHGKRLQMFFPCDDGYQPARAAVLRNMAMGALNWEHCITHRIEAADAPAIFKRINQGDPELTGVLVHWSD
ncbi:MAG: zinc-binding alcohol dehydrogenase [Armatimonadetes bacterium]|nr:zinc-binding alcohol dehydrogenase [Armatimonadota bacterium]